MSASEPTLPASRVTVTEAGRWRKKPVVIEAMRWSGLEADLPALFEFIGDFKKLPDDGTHVNGPGVGYTPADGCVYIPTLEGTMTASPGDYVIRGVAKEIYPCKPDIFAATYEPEEAARTCRRDTLLERREASDSEAGSEK